MNKRFGSIYLVTNLITGDAYVGQTVKSVTHRWKAHCRTAASSPKMEVSRQISAYGEHMFYVEEVFAAYDKQALNGAEKALIAQLGPSLNRTRGGAGSARLVSDAEREVRRQNLRKRWADPAWREANILALRSAERRLPPYEVMRQNGERACARRWEGHTKKVAPSPADRSAVTRATWENAEIRSRRIAAIKIANARSEVQARRSEASRGRRHTRNVLEKIARSKWKPVFCPELGVSFLSQTYAADFLGVLKTTVSNAVKSKGKVNGCFTLIRVA